MAERLYYIIYACFLIKIKDAIMPETEIVLDNIQMV